MLAALSGGEGLGDPLACTAGLALVALGGLTALSLRRGAPPRLGCAGAGALGALGAGLLALGLRPSLALPPLLLAAVCGLPLAARSARAARAGAAALALPRRRSPACWLLLLAAPPLGLWWACGVARQSRAIRDVDTAVRLAADDGGLEELASAGAATDLGRPVRLFRPGAGAPPAGVAEGEAALLADRELMEQMIRVGPADQGYNCHGWVFAGGRCWVKGEDVELLLRDNGYAPARSPQKDDLLVYRDREGRPTHSGVVRAVTPAGVILVESKWGRLGRFVHTPDCYPGRRTYYRTPRGGHEVRVLGPPVTVVGR